MSEFANMDGIVSHARAVWRPPPVLSLSQWADENYYLSSESSTEPGRWRTIPYQRGPMDAITDPAVERVTLKKSARVGYTKIIGAAIGHYIEHDPSGMLVVQPTVEDATGYSKEEIAPMLRDCPSLRAIAFKDGDNVGTKDGNNTILHKRFSNGVVLSLAGANSASGFRRITRRVIIFDEVDGYPPSAGSEGDQIRLGTMRSQTFWNRKIIAGSTPGIAGTSRIERMFYEGDQRRYFVPCPQCGHMAPLVFKRKGDDEESKGHWMTWPEGKPEDAFFTCQRSGCVIEHSQKRAMVERGEWRAAAPFKGHASFHIWAAYSYSANATWGQIASEFVACKSDVEQLKTFVNTVLGETWVEVGDVPDWEKIYARREHYEIGTVPDGVKFITAGVDVQRDRWVYEIVGWGDDKQSWSIDSGVIPGRTWDLKEWSKLDDLLSRTYPTSTDQDLPIWMLAVDSGDQTQVVYSWARPRVGRVIAVKGQSTARVVLGSPTPVDVKLNGQKIVRGCKVWPVGTDIVKGEIYGWLQLQRPEPGESHPTGWCHFPEYGEDFFKQITAEQLVTVKTPKGFSKMEWQLLPGRENHFLDCRVYARAAASVGARLDRMRSRPRRDPSETERSGDKRQPIPPNVSKSPRPVRADSGFWGGRGKDWFRRR